MQDKQGGSIGFSLFILGLIPTTSSKDDATATQRAQDFYVGWWVRHKLFQNIVQHISIKKIYSLKLRFLRPLLFGDYPDTMKRTIGSRLPVFSEKESEQVKGSCDFVGVIHYHAASVTNIKSKPSLSGNPDFYSYMGVSFHCMNQTQSFK